MVQLTQIIAFGKYLQSIVNKEIENKDSESLFALIRAAKYHNRWFAEDVVISRLNSITLFLQSEKFEELFNYLNDSGNYKTIGYISEENIPLEEFSNILFLEIAGHSVFYKIEEHNDKLLPYILGLFFKHTNSKSNITFYETSLPKTDLLFISQRNKPSTTLQEYTILKNSIYDIRHQSVAIINGKENEEELNLLAGDVFSYFGQGSGNVRKVYIPENFDVRILYPSFESWSKVLDHNPYANNYQYHQSIFLMNRIEHYDNGFLLVKEDKEPRAPTGILYYEFYIDETELMRKLAMHDFYAIYKSIPKANNEKAFGESANQSLIPSEKLKALLF